MFKHLYMDLYIKCCEMYNYKIILYTGNNTFCCSPKFSVGSTTGAVILMVNLESKDQTASMVTDEVNP